MLDYIYRNIRYPQKAHDLGIEETAVIRFVVEPHGAITNVSILRDPGAGTGEAAAQVVRDMRQVGMRWEPGLQKGKPVRVFFHLPVKFKLR
jgi:protein TonB